MGKYLQDHLVQSLYVIDEEMQVQGGFPNSHSFVHQGLAEPYAKSDIIPENRTGKVLAHMDYILVGPREKK